METWEWPARSPTERAPEITWRVSRSWRPSSSIGVPSVRAGVEIHVLGQQLEALAGGHHLMVGTKGKLVIEPLPVVK